MDRKKYVMLNTADHVAVALEEIPSGTAIRVEIDGSSVDIRLLDTIEFGHKFAVRPIAEGSEILQYGEVIGRAGCSIPGGSHVHVHNLEGIRGRGDRNETGK